MMAVQGIIKRHKNRDRLLFPFNRDRLNDNLKAHSSNRSPLNDNLKANSMLNEKGVLIVETVLEVD